MSYEQKVEKLASKLNQPITKVKTELSKLTSEQRNVCFELQVDPATYRRNLEDHEERAADKKEAFKQFNATHPA